MADVDVAIVGAGAVGLACAAQLAHAGRSVLLVERHGSAGQETSSRHSGVIHAGLYYPPKSLKAQLCVQGRDLLYARCARDGIAHRKLGKLVVATEDAQVPQLEAIRERGLHNGAGALRMLDAAQVCALEPHVRAVAALWSPQTGIVDAHALLDSYKAEATAHGAQIAWHTALHALERSGQTWRLHTRAANGEAFAFEASWVVNAAGLAADRVAAMAGLDVDTLGWRLHPCKGDYFALASRLRGIAQRLVYPVPVQAGLGIHLTIDLGGKLVAGPDVEYVDRVRYDVDPRKAAVFGAALRRYLPEVRDEDLTPDYAGVRPKLQRPGEAFADFVIEEASAHGAPGLINLVGIESPGLTASEAIAKRVALMIA